MMKPYVLLLSDAQADIETVGGKGMSLAKLVTAGLPVPDGFHITTEAYRLFVRANELQKGIDEALRSVDIVRPTSLESASIAIMRLFTEAPIPDDLAGAITQAYSALSGMNPPVAVRSSATAEDLPDASFAGQHDTYLNMTGSDQVLKAVRKCWASLWTARAIGYRARQNISSDKVALAVIVQALVKAEAAGILFTVNPTGGKREEMVVNAVWGLGEAVVGGVVTPDILTIDKGSGKVIRRETAEKRLMTVCTGEGTTEQSVPDSRVHMPVLSDENAARLARLGMQIEKLYGIPMDIEWVFDGEKFAIVQARPITALGEEPLEWKPPKSKGVYMRASLIDLMPDPASPLFITFGIPTMVSQMNPLGKQLTGIYPHIDEDYFTTINTYGYLNAGFSGRVWLWVIFGLIPAYPRLLRMLVPFWRDIARPQYQRSVAEMQGKDFERMSGAELWQTAQSVMDAAAYYTCSLLFATMGASGGSEGLLTKVYNKFARREGDPPANTLLMGWNNIPARSEKSLFDLAEFCREHEFFRAYVLNTPSKELVEALKSRQVPEGVDSGIWREFLQRFDHHMQQFGHVIFQLDFAIPLPCDLPETMLETVKMFLRGEGANPHERQKNREQKRIQMTESVLGRLKGFRRWVFRIVLNWAQSLSEVREDALADIGLGYPLLRRMLHILGERLVKSGSLQEAGDIYWLEKAEIDQDLAALEKNLPLDSRMDAVQQRKAFWKRARQSTPPPMLPSRKRYMGIDTSVWLPEPESGQTKESLKGVATSPGRATATACVLHGPEDFDQMRSGDVLVASATTPAWTPLFAMASAVVTDIGGPLSHGSIVAREYGIPAVMGTGVATRRIHSGQIITVDGGTGIVTL